MKAICGCCRPGARPTPLEVDNRPSLSAIVYRIGTFSSFREAMLEEIADQPELAGLTTRRSDDYGVTTMEMWAAVADVLTFYQERYANEAFLRTASFRDSIIRLADLLGYRLRPGVAARAWVAFTLDAGKTLEIPIGQKVQSVPEAGQQPQTFETLMAVQGDAAWNRLRVFPAPVATPPLQASNSEEILDRLTGPAVAAALTPGSSVVLFNTATTDAVEEKKVAAVRNQDDIVFLEWDVPIKKTTWSAATKVMRFRRTFKWFGHNAPSQYVVPSAPVGIPTRISWSLTNLPSLAVGGSGTIDLDGKYENLAPGQQLLVDDTDGSKTLVTISSVKQVNATFGPVADTVTQLAVTPALPAIASRRNVVIYELQGDAVVFASSRYGAQVTGDTVYLPGVAVADPLRGSGVEVGRTAIRGAFTPGVTIFLDEVEKGRGLLLGDAAAEPVNATLKDKPGLLPASPANGAFCHLVLPLSVTGTLQLSAESSFLLGNVAEASHGESVIAEAVASGNASAVFQRARLKKKPLTWLSGAKGLTSTLDLKVNGVRWKEVPQLYGQAFDARVFETRAEDDGSTTIQFGDGVTGSRLPTGANNVTADYRFGSGLSGRVARNSLTTLLAKPAGLLAAFNPRAAEGGSDAETLDEARRNAPRSVRTFGRIVSLLDFEDEVTASGEVAKALATWVWDGLDRGVHLTIAGAAGGLFSDQARRDLGESLKLKRDPNHRLVIDNYTQVFIEFRAGVAVDPAHDQDTVLEAARQAVIDALSFDNMRLAQPVHLSDLYRVLQDVPGVVFVDVERLMFKQPAGMSPLEFLFFLWQRRVQFATWFLPAAVQARLRIFGARPSPLEKGKTLPAELAAFQSPTQDLIIEPRAIA